jgi:replicative DNA helicase
MDRVQRDIQDFQRSPEIRTRALFAATRTINAKGLQRWTEWAVDHGCEFVMVDHIDRIAHGPGVNAFHEMSETVRLAKELAVEHRLVMLVASQVGRPGDALEQFMPPALHQLRGGGTKEEEADTVLGVYRPLRASVSEQELKLVRQGLRDRDTVIEPNVMGVMVLKHRLDGPQAGKIVKLTVHHQRVTDVTSLPERDRYTTRYTTAYGREIE